MEETDEAGPLIVSFTYGDDLVRQNRTGSMSYYHYDGQMSTRKLTDATGAVTDGYVYDAFGVLLGQTGTTINNYLYTGEQYDPNVGFYYLRARYYNQAIGRFATPDSFEGGIFDPISLHKYLYGGANPANNIDPTGHFFTISYVMVTISIISILLSMPKVTYAELPPLIGFTLDFIKIKRNNAFPITFGTDYTSVHWWIEMVDNGITESYGWWPEKFEWRALIDGVDGKLNDHSGFANRDPKQGESADIEFHPVLLKSKKNYNQIKNEIRDFANNYAKNYGSKWRLVGPNCRTFQMDLMNSVGLGEPSWSSNRPHGIIEIRF